MRNFLAGAALAVLAATAVSADPGGGGHGGKAGGQDRGGSGNGGQERSAQGHGGGPGNGKHGGGDSRQADVFAGQSERGQGHGNGHGDRGDDHRSQPDRGGFAAQADNYAPQRGYRNDRSNGSPRRDIGRTAQLDRERSARFDPRGAADSGSPVFARFDGTRGVIGGCPPGLAKKHNGCLPPGQARDHDAYRPDWFGLNGSRGDGYRYTDGYLLRYDGDRVLGYVPLLGGALSAGNIWPSAFDTPPLPDYYRSYYDLGSSDAYRYYDGTIYRVDPQNSAITSIAALLTGDRFDIGQQLPQGYSAYNVPYEYRDRYPDKIGRASCRERV